MKIQRKAPDCTYISGKKADKFEKNSFLINKLVKYNFLGMLYSAKWFVSI